MTERSTSALARDADMLTIGPSALRWEGDALSIDFHEVTAPIPKRLRGVVTLRPHAIAEVAYPLDPRGRHHWRPIAPRARVEVELGRPDLRWSGEGYLDANQGTEPLEDGFAQWRWSRAHLRRDTAVLYEGTRRDGSALSLGLRFDANGQASPVEMPPELVLPRTGWRMDRRTRADAGAAVTIRNTWEDTPFYARTALSTRLFGEAADAVHESLSLDRLRHPLVRAMLPFRMPRIFWR